MVERAGVSLGTRRTAEGVVLVDRSCGACSTCALGAPAWCVQPMPDGRDLTAPLAPRSADALASALGGAAALLEVAAPATVLVVGELRGPLAILVHALAPALVLVALDPYDPAIRSALAEAEPSGRARTLVAGSDARAAVKVVRRGGHVCVGHPNAVMPSVTELVQREVTLVGPRDFGAVVRRVGESTWADATRAAA